MIARMHARIAIPYIAENPKQITQRGNRPSHLITVQKNKQKKRNPNRNNETLAKTNDKEQK